MSRVTLSRYLIEQTRSNNTPADLRFLIEVVARACKEISHAVSKGALGGVLGSMGTENVQGEVQKKLDVISNEILLEANEWGGHLAGMASEEMDNAYQIPGKYPKGAYLLVFDPLDGSSNIDINAPVGTIFSVLRCPNEYLSQNEALNEKAFLQPGTEQVAAGYAIYGPQTMLVLTLGDGWLRTSGAACPAWTARGCRVAARSLKKITQNCRPACQRPRWSRCWASRLIVLARWVCPVAPGAIKTALSACNMPVTKY